MLPRVFTQTSEELRVRLGDSMRRARPFSIGIFANGEQDLAHRGLDARLVEVALAAHEPSLHPLANA